VKLYHDTLVYLLWRAKEKQAKVPEESFNEYFSDAAASVEQKIAFLTDNIAAYCADGRTVKYKTWKKNGRVRFKGIPKLSSCSGPWSPIENLKRKKTPDHARAVTALEKSPSPIPASRTPGEASDPPNPKRAGARLSDPIILDDTVQENSCAATPERNASRVIIDLESDPTEVPGYISPKRINPRQPLEIILLSDSSAVSSPLSSPTDSLLPEGFDRQTSDSGYDDSIGLPVDANRVLKDYITANSQDFFNNWRRVMSYLGVPETVPKCFHEKGLSIDDVARTWMDVFPEFWGPVGMERQRVEAFIASFMDQWLSDQIGNEADTAAVVDASEDKSLHIEQDQRPEDFDHNIPAMATQEGKLQPHVASPPPLLPLPLPSPPSLPSPPADDEISLPVRHVINLDDEAPIAQSVIGKIKPVIEKSKLCQPHTDIEAEHEMTPPETPPEEMVSNQENRPSPTRMSDLFGLQDDDEPPEIAAVWTSNKMPRKGKVATATGNQLKSEVRSSEILAAKDFQLDDALPKMRLEWQRTAWCSTRPLSFIAEARVDSVKNQTLVREKSLPRLEEEERRIAEQLIVLDAESKELNDSFAERLASSIKVDWAKYHAVMHEQQAANEEHSRRREKLSNDVLAIAKATDQLKRTGEVMETPGLSMELTSDTPDEVLLEGSFHRFIPLPRGTGDRDEFLQDLLPWAKISDPSPPPPPPLPKKKKPVRKKRRW